MARHIGWVEVDQFVDAFLGLGLVYDFSSLDLRNAAPGLAIQG
jgi:hypothetical protein